MFFQILLLADTSRSFVGFPSKLQESGLAVAALLAISVVMLGARAFSWPSPITPGVASGLVYLVLVCTILKFLSLAIGLPFLILSTTARCCRTGLPRLPRRFALSPLRRCPTPVSLLGLLSYPFFLEQMLRLQKQAWLGRSPTLFTL